MHLFKLDRVSKGQTIKLFRKQTRSGENGHIAATIRMGHRFKFNSIDVRMLTCAGVEISMDPPELLDKKFIGLQRREKNIFL